jgi:hypothetical protein
MKKILFGILLGVCISTVWQTVTFSQSPAPPGIAFDITKADIDLVLKNAPPAVDQQLRVVDVGKYNVAVGVIYRGALKNNPGEPIRGPYHDDSAEVYIIRSGSGVLTTGSSMIDKKPSTNYSLLNGPGGSGAAGANAFSRRVSPGDIIIIPPGVLHVFTEITDHISYLSVRPDPGRVLPAGYVHPSLLKNGPAVVK